MNNRKEKLLVVVGSSNTDMVVKTSRIPSPGETILGGRFFMNSGGKGANQAVAAARLGGQVCFISRIGKDIFGEEALRSFKQEKIDVTCILQDEEQPSGVALITVDDRGENSITVAPGSNGFLSSYDILQYRTKIEKASVILAQLETPLETIETLAGIAEKYQIPFILNPAPVQMLSEELLAKVSILTPNEHEAGMLTGIRVVDAKSAGEAARILHGRGVRSVIITLGKQGAFLSENGMAHFLKAPVVEAMDTTAAGDVFNGALAVYLAEGRSLPDAVEFANRAAALSVTRMGAQASAPFREEMENYYTHK